MYVCTTMTKYRVSQHKYWKILFETKVAWNHLLLSGLKISMSSIWVIDLLILLFPAIFCRSLRSLDTVSTEQSNYWQHFYCSILSVCLFWVNIRNYLIYFTTIFTEIFTEKGNITMQLHAMCLVKTINK